MDINKLIHEAEAVVGVGSAVASNPASVSKAVMTVEHVKTILTSIQAILALYHQPKV